MGVQKQRTTEYVGHKDAGTVEIHSLSERVNGGELPLDGDAEQFGDEVTLEQVFKELSLIEVCDLHAQLGFLPLRLVLWGIHGRV